MICLCMYMYCYSSMLLNIFVWLNERNTNTRIMIYKTAPWMRTNCFVSITYVRSMPHHRTRNNQLLNLTGDVVMHVISIPVLDVCYLHVCIRLVLSLMAVFHTIVWVREVSGWVILIQNSTIQFMEIRESVQVTPLLINSSCETVWMATVE